jgi:hypothetical protein
MGFRAASGWLFKRLQRAVRKDGARRRRDHNPMSLLRSYTAIDVSITIKILPYGA